MSQLWWFIHILGISIWFGGLTAVLMAWSSAGQSHSLRLLVRLVNRASHTGAGLTALGGTAMSIMMQPKSELAAFWLMYMQGAGVVAFFLSITVLTRMGRRITKQLATDEADSPVARHATHYVRWLWVVWILLLSSLVMAAFKPTW